MITVSQNQDIVYPFILAADIDISFISDIKLAIKDKRILKNSIFVRSIKATSGTVTIIFGSDTVPALGEVVILDSGWGTIDNLYIFGFVYISVIPSILILYAKNLYILPICCNFGEDTENLKKTLKIDNDTYSLDKLLLIVGQGAIKVWASDNVVHILRLTEPLYLFGEYQAKTPYYITSVNNFDVTTLHFICHENTPLSITLKNDTIFFQSKKGFPVCKNQQRVI